MHYGSRPIARPSRVAVATLAILAFAVPGARAGDVTVPAEVTGLVVSVSGNDVVLTWDPVTLDAAGQPESVDQYRVYRGNGPSFPTDFVSLTSSTTTDALDTAAATDADSYYYLVTARDTAGNEGPGRPTLFTASPVLSGFWTADSIELSWTAAEPNAEIVGYRVYFGQESRAYQFVQDVGLATSHSLGGLETFRNYYISVTAVGTDGSESAFSNEHIDALAGTVRVQAHDESRFCFGGCPPGVNEISRDSNKEKIVEVDFPEGDWVRATLTFIADSRLCNNVPDKCGDQNPGWNPCGDPWDRTASVYLVLDDCVETGARCYARPGNLELLRAITPFGTDAAPPDGSGFVGPAVWTMDITPYASLLTGTRHVGAFIDTWVSPGWYGNVEFEFTEDPAQASTKPPADGVAVVDFHHGADLPAVPVTIPPEADQVFARVFLTGHGAFSGSECACPGRPCDEFCEKLALIRVGSTLPWTHTPHRTDCSPLGENICGGGTCQQWNACGCPSCTFDRSGWCPGKLVCHQNEPCDQDLEATSWFTPGTTEDVHLTVKYTTVLVDGQPQIAPGVAWTRSLAIYWYDTN